MEASTAPTSAFDKPPSSAAKQSCDCGAAGARHPINELRGDRARLALGKEQSSGSRHRLRGDLDGAVLGQSVLETGAGERINNLEIPGWRARGQGLEHGEIVLVDEDGAAPPNP